MGNRAVLSFKGTNIGVYLHWNGGRDSVEGFLKYCQIQGFRSPDQDPYGIPMLTTVIANFFSDGMSLGVDNIENLDTDNYDNGMYIIQGWKIIGRKFNRNEEQNNTKLETMLKKINENQPTWMKIKYNKWLETK